MLVQRRGQSKNELAYRTHPLSSSYKEACFGSDFEGRPQMSLPNPDLLLKLLIAGGGHLFGTKEGTGACRNDERHDLTPVQSSDEVGGEPRSWNRHGWPPRWRRRRRRRSCWSSRLQQLVVGRGGRCRAVEAGRLEQGALGFNPTEHSDLRGSGELRRCHSFKPRPKSRVPRPTLCRLS